VIERDAQIKFHEQGTLNAVTRWIATHDEGIAEWLKNARRAYQTDRASVSEEHRVAILLLKDKDSRGAARIGLLDVGGATVEDVTAWSTWQDPDASSRASHVAEEETQGNGGKAYMFRLFRGRAMILGVAAGKRNCKGFDGEPGSVERGTPGFIPDTVSGREVPVTSPRAELTRLLEPYALSVPDLPEQLWSAIDERQAFTLVEGLEPTGLYHGRIDVEDLVAKVLRHEQSTVAIQQLHLYAIHNGRILNDGKPLELPSIEPYPGLEGPFVYQIPESLEMPDGVVVSTTEGGNRPGGRLVLQTSRDHMPNAYKNLKPRWRISYRTEHQMIGSKPVSDLAPATPGASFIYGVIELPALEPGYVEHGRRRPKDGPLVEAIDWFTAGRIRDLAKQINERRRRDLDARALDQVQEENQRLDLFKNRFLPAEGHGEGGFGRDGRGPHDSNGAERPAPTRGTIPDSIEMSVPESGLFIARGVEIHLGSALRTRVVDDAGHQVLADVAWHSADPSVIRVLRGDQAEARNKGRTEIWATVQMDRTTSLQSERIEVEVWAVDHVLLTPRAIQLGLGRRAQILAEVTNDEGGRSADVYLSWRHDSADQLIVRIGSTGYVTGNRLGRTSVTAGTPDPVVGGTWARIPVEVEVIPNTDQPERGGGYPRLLLTGRDVDPASGEIREGDPDSPALWQEASDFINNVWWFNLQSPEAAFAFGEREQNPTLWRALHAQVVMDMVVHVHMQVEFTKKGETEQEDYWANHLRALDRYSVQVTQQMWTELESYVADGADL